MNNYFKFVFHKVGESVCYLKLVSYLIYVLDLHYVSMYVRNCTLIFIIFALSPFYILIYMF